MELFQASRCAMSLGISYHYSLLEPSLVLMFLY